MKTKLTAIVLGIAIALSAGVVAQITGGGPEGGGNRPNGTNFSTQYKNGANFAGTGPGTSGQVLTSRGAGLSPTYQTLTSGSTFGADAKSTWNVTTADLSIGTVAVPSVFHGLDGTGGSAGAQLTVRSGHGNSNNGGLMALVAGSGGGGSGTGGAIAVQAGTGTANGAGGAVNIAAGATQRTGTGPAAGGAVNIISGDSDQGTPGAVVIDTGQSATAVGGALTLKTKGVARLSFVGSGAAQFDSAVTFNASGNTFGGTVTTGDDLTIQATLFRNNPSNPTTLGSGNTNDYNPTNLGSRSIFRITPDSAAGSTITGIVSMTAGMEITFFNIQTGATGTLTIAHESASSTAANRIICPGEANLAVLAGGSVTFWRDGTTSRWRVKH